MRKVQVYIGDSQQMVLESLLALNENGTHKKHYLSAPDENGIYQPDTETISAEAKVKCKSTMKACSEAHCCDGALVTATVDGIEYTGIFCPGDSIFEGASGASAYRDLLNPDVDPVEIGPVWYTKDGNGNDVDFPITESLVQRIKYEITNWETACSRIYHERKRAMLEMDDISDFDSEADIKNYLPSREITIL